MAIEESPPVETGMASSRRSRDGTSSTRARRGGSARTASGAVRGSSRRGSRGRGSASTSRCSTRATRWRDHAESNQEDFLVVSGECLLVIEGEERLLRQWDFVHCPPWTEHVLIGAGVRPAVVVAVSTRAPDAGVRYVASEVAAGTARRRRTTRSRPPRRTRTTRPAAPRIPRGDLPG